MSPLDFFFAGLEPLTRDPRLDADTRGELRLYLQRGDGVMGYQTPFLRRVVAPLLRARKILQEGDTEPVLLRALEAVGKCTETAIRDAITDWLKKRIKAMETDGLVEAVLRLREAGKVERCHTLPISGRHGYTVGQHCYDMLSLLVALHPDPRGALFKAVMYHDAHERWTGDIPGALKYLSKDLAHTMDEQKAKIDELLGFDVHMEFLTVEEKKWLKALDRIEFLLWCEDQVHLGNDHVRGRLEAVQDQLKETPMPPECATFLERFKWRRTHDNAIR